MNMQQNDFPKKNRQQNKRHKLLNFVFLEFSICFPPDEIVQTEYILTLKSLVENQQGELNVFIWHYQC